MAGVDKSLRPFGHRAVCHDSPLMNECYGDLQGMMGCSGPRVDDDCCLVNAARILEDAAGTSAVPRVYGALWCYIITISNDDHATTSCMQ